MNYYITIKALYRYPISLDFPMKSFISACFPPFFGLKALHFFHPKNMSSLNVPARWVLLLDKTFQTRKNTVYRVTSSLMSELPELTLAEARTQAEHARDPAEAAKPNGFSG